MIPHHPHHQNTNPANTTTRSRDLRHLPHHSHTTSASVTSRGHTGLRSHTRRTRPDRSARGASTTPGERRRRTAAPETPAVSRRLCGDDRRRTRRLTHRSALSRVRSALLVLTQGDRRGGVGERRVSGRCWRQMARQSSPQTCGLGSFCDISTVLSSEH